MRTRLRVYTSVSHVVEYRFPELSCSSLIEAPWMFARKHMLQMCRARSSAASLSGLCSVAMRETLFAEVDLTDAVVDLVKQGHYLGVSIAIFGPFLLKIH